MKKAKHLKAFALHVKVREVYTKEEASFIVVRHGFVPQHLGSVWDYLVIGQ